MVASEIHYPLSIVELLELMRRNPATLLFGGGTEILRERGGRYIDLPPVVALLEGLAELRAVNLTERYIDIGAGMTMAEILELKAGTLPEALIQTIRGIATPSIRNLATIGGNLATQRHFMDTWPILACFEALVEFRDGAGIRWMNVNRLMDDDGHPSFPSGSLLSRIRVPIESWSWTVSRKTGNRSWPAHDSAVFALLARVDKGIITTFRMAYAGEQALRFPELEARIVGARLPLAQKERAALREDYREAALARSPSMGARFIALLDMALEKFSR